MNQTKSIMLITALSLLTFLRAYSQQYSCVGTLEESLQRTANILNEEKSKALWGVSLNAPIIIVDHTTNKMFVTAIENGVVLPPKEESWDHKIPLSNSFFEYNGKTYVTIIYAAIMNIPCEQRVNLLSHEIFHYHQKSLGIKNEMSRNFHLDEIQGRALLQIEMKLLQEALEGNESSLFDAIYIRKYRQKLFPNNNEDLYELNEGLAEYTGVKLSTENMKEYVKQRLNYNISQGYTNAFGYFTGAAYATILDKIYPKWHYDKDLTKGLIYLIKKRDSRYESVIKDDYIEQLLTKYNYNQITRIEEKELDSFGNIEDFKRLLKTNTSKLIIKNEKINFTYNPNDKIVSLGDAVLLRNLTITAEWGRMKVQSGIVRLNNWSAFYLLPPTSITSDTVEGDNYEIKINQGWKIIEEKGLYEIVRL